MIPPSLRVCLHRGCFGRFVKAALISTASLSVTMLSGCLWPPHSDNASAAKLIPNDHLGLTGETASAAQMQWWKAYGDPQLDRLVDDALRDNPGLAEAMTRVRSAHAQALGVGAAAFPQASLSGSTLREHFAQHSTYPPPVAGGEYWISNLTTNLTWDLDLFGRQAALIEQAKTELKASHLEVATTQLMLAGALSQAYVDLYRNYVLADIARRSEEQREHILELTRKRVAAGLDTQVELRAAETAVPEARLSRMQAQAATDLAVHQLAALSGKGAEAYASIQRPALNIETLLPLPTALPSNLLGRRPDVIAARLHVDAALAGKKAAHQAYYPNINISALAGLQAIGLGNLFEASARQFGAGPAIYLPLFDGGSLDARYQGAGAAVDSAIERYNQTVLAAIQQTADQLSRVANYAQQLVEARAAAQSAEQGYLLAEKRYAAGLSTQLTVLNAETQVLNARSAVVQILANQTMARVSLLLALGGSFEVPPEAAAAAAPRS